MNQWKEMFKKTHPDVTIEWLDKKGTEFSTFYQTQVVAGTAPDIIDVQGGLWLEYASQGGLVDLTPYLKRDKAFTAGLYPEVLNGWAFEGKNYGVPFYISKTLLFYNKLMFKEAGLTNPPTTFDQLMNYAAKMTKGEKSGFMTLNFDWLYWPLFAENGVNLLTPDLKKAAFNTPKAVALVEKLAKATKDGVINKISWTGRWVEPNGAFAAGTIGMLNAPCPRLSVVQEQGGVGQRGYRRRGRFPRPLVDAELARVSHLQGFQVSPRGVGLRQDDQQRRRCLRLRYRQQQPDRRQGRQRQADGLFQGEDPGRYSGVGDAAEAPGQTDRQLADRQGCPGQGSLLSRTAGGPSGRQERQGSAGRSREEGQSRSEPSLMAARRVSARDGWVPDIPAPFPPSMKPV